MAAHSSVPPKFAGVALFLARVRARVWQATALARMP